MEPRPPNTAAANPLTVIADVGAVRHRVARREERAAERAKRARAGERDDPQRADVEADELGSAAGVGTGDERLADDRSAEEERQSDGASSATPAISTYCGWTTTPPTFHARSEMPGIAAGNVSELEQEQRLCEERRAERDDRAREARRSIAEANGDDREDATPGSAAIRIETGLASASGMSSDSWKVKSPPITTNTPCAKLTMPVVR